MPYPLSSAAFSRSPISPRIAFRLSRLVAVFSTVSIWLLVAASWSDCVAISALRLLGSAALTASVTAETLSVAPPSVAFVMKLKALKLLSSAEAIDRLVAIFVISAIDVPAGSACITVAVILNACVIASLALTPACLALSEASITLPIEIAAEVIFCAAAIIAVLPLLIASTKLNEPRSRSAGSPSIALSSVSVMAPDATRVDSGDTTGLPTPSLADRVSENFLPVKVSVVCSSETMMNFAPATD